MAEDNDPESQTEDPTQKRLEEALERGDVAKSHELTTWFVLGAATLGVFLFAPGGARDLAASWRGFIANAGLAVLSRLMPQMQVFFIALPATIMLGLVLFAAVIATMMAVWLGYLQDGLQMFVVR